jgi:hypothetical protein
MCLLHEYFMGGKFIEIFVCMIYVMTPLGTNLPIICIVIGGLLLEIKMSDGIIEKVWIPLISAFIKKPPNGVQIQIKTNQNDKWKIESDD